MPDRSCTKVCFHHKEAVSDRNERDMKLFSLLTRIFGGRRRLASGSAFADEPGPLEQWKLFLESEAFNNVTQQYALACNKASENIILPRQSHQSASLSIEDWQAALTTTCQFLHSLDDEISLFVLDQIQFRKYKDEIWETLVFLIHGVYFMNHGRRLHKLMDMNDTSLHLLHAATYSLSRCTSNDNNDDEGSHSLSNVETRGSTSALFVFRTVLEKHPEQLLQIEPIWNRTPLHIAAANQCYPIPASIKELCGSEDVDLEVGSNLDSNLDVDEGCSTEILEEILSRTPAEFAGRKDGTGNYPMHLAAAGGCGWASGLGKLLCTAPQIMDDRSLPPVFVVASELGTLDTVFRTSLA